MVVEDPDQQSATGKLVSGYEKFEGYRNIFGSIVGFIFGGLMILGGIFLALLINNSFPLIFSGIGLLIILFCIFSLKWSKRMREGKYYQVGKGWVKPQ